MRLNQNAVTKIILASFIVAALASDVVPHAFGSAYTGDMIKSVTTSKEAQIESIRDQEIQQLKIVLARRFDESKRPDLLLRLSELYVEKYRFLFLKENEYYQELLKKGMKPSNVDHTLSKAQLKFATDSCKEILRSQVPFASMDKVYYFLGYNAQELDNEKDAAGYFKVIIERYPQSQFVAESYRNLGEYYYNKREYPTAVSYYEKASKFTNVPSYPRTLYKLAWAQFRVRRKTEALDSMKRAVSASSKDEKFIALKDEAVNDLVYFFADSGRFQEAKEYFNSIGGNDIYTKALTRLSKAFERDGKVNQSFSINDALLAEQGEKNPALAWEILVHNIELSKKTANMKLEEDYVQKLIQYFTKHSSELLGSDNGKSIYVQAKNFVKSRATESHKEAVKRKDPKQFSRAADLYAQYLKAFLQSPGDDKERKELAQVRIYYSDTLLASGRESEAVPVLEASLGDEKGDPKLRREAGTSLLNILIKKVDALKGAKAGSAANADEIETHFIKVAEQFEDAFPNDPLIAELKYKKSRLLVNHSGPDGLSSKSRSTLKDLIAKYPERTESLESAHDLVSDSLKKKEEGEATELANAFLANKALMANDAKKSNELRTYLQTIIARGKFENVQALEKSSDYKNAAVEYEKLAASATDREVAQKSLNNAGVNYEKADEVADAFRIYSKIKNKDALKRLATESLAKSKFTQAADLFYKLYQNPIFSNDERQAFLKTSFTLYWGSGDRVSAAKISETAFATYCEQNSRSSFCHDLVFSTTRIFDESGKPQEAIRILKNYLASKWPEKRVVQANFETAVYYSKLHESIKAHGAYQAASQFYAKGSKPKDAPKQHWVSERKYAAKAALMLAQPLYDQFSQVRLELPEEKLKANTKLKLSMIEKIVERYQTVVAYGDGEAALSSLVKIAGAFSRFADEIVNSPVPDRISKDKVLLEKYRGQLGQIAAPMKARAVEFLKQAYRRGLQLRLVTPSFSETVREISILLPQENPPAAYTYRFLPEGISGTVKDNDAKDLMNADHEWRREIAESLKKNPKKVEAWVDLGNIEALTGRLVLARLCYEQAISLNPKNASALNNLALIMNAEGDALAASDVIKTAVANAEFNKTILFNQAALMLTYKHFQPALEILKPLSARNPEDLQIQTALAAASLGSADFKGAYALLDKLDAKGNKSFPLWFNWSVWAGLKGDGGQKEDAEDYLKDRKEKFSGESLEDINAALKALFSKGGK